MKIGELLKKGENDLTKRKLTIHEAVRDEVVDAVVYYEEQQLGLGNSLLEEWEKFINRIHLFILVFWILGMLL